MLVICPPLVEISGEFQPKVCFLPRWLWLRFLPEERYSDSLSGLLVELLIVTLFYIFSSDVKYVSNILLQVM